MSTPSFSPQAQAQLSGGYHVTSAEQVGMAIAMRVEFIPG
jgi:hypothetical protein